MHSGNYTYLRKLKTYESFIIWSSAMKGWKYFNLLALEKDVSFVFCYVLASCIPSPLEIMNAQCSGYFMTH